MKNGISTVFSISVVIFSVGFLVVINTIDVRAMSLFPKAKFRFEDYRDRWHPKDEGKYKTTKQGLEDLKKLHPFGSSLIPLIETLAALGAHCKKSGFRENILCLYRKGFLVVDDWRVIIVYDHNNNLIETVSGSWIIDVDSKSNKARRIVSYSFSWGLDGI